MDQNTQIQTRSTDCNKHPFLFDYCKKNKCDIDIFGAHVDLAERTLVAQKNGANRLLISRFRDVLSWRITEDLRRVALEQIASGNFETITKTTATQRYGKQVLELCPWCFVVDNPYYRSAAPMQLFLPALLDTLAVGVEAADPEKREKRKTAASKAVITKRAKLLASIKCMDVSVTKKSYNVVRRLAIDAYNDRNWDTNKLAGIHSDPGFLKRICVNYIRHELSAYDFALEEAAGKVGAREAVDLIREKIYTAIAMSYPRLTEECRRQMQQRGASV